jgi:hypothetical protein
MEPNDYYRFTKYGLKHLGESHGFVVEHIEPHGGIFHVLSYIIITLPIRLFLQPYPKVGIWYMVLFSPFIAVINMSAFVLDHFDREKRLTINYEVVYRKV